jgi:hypothetical protein
VWQRYPVHCFEDSRKWTGPSGGIYPRHPDSQTPSRHRGWEPLQPTGAWGAEFVTSNSLLGSKHEALDPEEELSLLSQATQKAKLATQRPATLVKNCFLPLREYFKYFSQNSVPLYK